jgi:hypothetical protein
VVAVCACVFLTCAHTRMAAFGAQHSRCGVLARDLADALRKQDKYIEARALVSSAGGRVRAVMLMRAV